MNDNGNGNGHGSLTQKKLERLFAYHSGISRALETTLALLRGEAITTRKHKGSDVLAAAVRLDDARRVIGRPPGSRDKAPRRPTAARRYTKENKLATRRRVAKFLEHFDANEARPIPEEFRNQSRQIGLGPLMYAGYLKRRGEGRYVRTNKTYEVHG